jgi:hypothetical protein
MPPLTRGMKKRARNTENASGADDDEDGICIVCMTNPKSVRFQPCLHSMYCFACGIRCIRLPGVCPACRADIMIIEWMNDYYGA